MDRILDSGSIDWGSTPHGCTSRNANQLQANLLAFPFYPKPLHLLPITQLCETSAHTLQKYILSSNPQNIPLLIWPQKTGISSQKSKKSLLFIAESQKISNFAPQNEKPPPQQHRGVAQSG